MLKKSALKQFRVSHVKSPHSAFNKEGEGDLTALPVERRVLTRRDLVRKTGSLFEHPALLVALRRLVRYPLKFLMFCVFQQPAKTENEAIQRSLMNFVLA